MSKTNILAETLAEIQELREAVSKNANHALKSTLKEELEEIVKNNLQEGIDDEESTDDMPGAELPGDLDQADNNDGGMGDGATDLSGEEGEEVIDLTDKSDEEVIKHFEPQRSNWMNIVMSNQFQQLMRLNNNLGKLPMK